MDTDTDLKILESIAQTKAKERYYDKLLTSFVDIVLDNTRLSYDGERLSLTSDGEDAVLLFVKTFFADEYGNKFADLYCEQELKEKEAKEAAKHEND